MWKKILSFTLGLTMVLCGFVGVWKAMPRPDAVIIDESAVETVSDSPEEDKENSPFQVEAKGAVLIDASTGQVLMEQDSHKELPLASVTKVMTMLLVMESCEEGKISLTDQVTISDYAASMGGSQMYMEAGEIHTVEELLQGVAMASANDGCVALAEYVAGSEEIFVERMNERAKELNMNDTNFVNTNGLPVSNHYSSAYDIAVMSKELYKYEEIRKWFTTWQSTITIGLPGKEKEFGLTNTNKLIKSYNGCDGIKTGFTSDAGYCLSASATRGETSLIAVALGCETSAVRNAQVSKMLDYGFANYETSVIAEKGQAVEEVNIAHGTPQVINAVAAEKITALTGKGAKDSIDYEIKIDETVSLPLKKGDKIGEIHVNQSGKTVKYDLTASVDVNKASFKVLFTRRFLHTNEKESTESKGDNSQ